LKHATQRSNICPARANATIAITCSQLNEQLPNYSTAPKKKDVPSAKITSSSNTFFDSSISQVIAEAEAALAAVESSALSTTTTPNSEEKPILPFYSSSLLSDESFIWVSGNNINDGRTGILNKREYLAAGCYFDLRSSFPDLEYRAHDFRVLIDEERGYSNGRIGGGSNGEITVRFTTLTTGTFRGSPLKLRSKIIPPNGKKMNCPPTAVSITFAAAGPEKGKIVKLVTDMVSSVYGNILFARASRAYAGILPSIINYVRSWTGKSAILKVFLVLLVLQR
jgi:hypothetical protein